MLCASSGICVRVNDWSAMLSFIIKLVTAAGNQISEEEGNLPLLLSSIFVIWLLVVS